MKKLFTMVLFGITLIYGQVASDNASSYVGSFTGVSFGTGFGGWTSTGLGSGSKGDFIGSSATQGFGNIDVSSKSFGIYANPSGTSLLVRRNLSTPLADGNTFKVNLAIAFRNGTKGIRLTTAAAAQLFELNVTSNVYNIKELAGSNTDLGWTYSQTSIFVLEYTQLTSTTAVARLTRGSDVYTTGTLTVSDRLSQIQFFIGDTDAGNDLNNLFFNSLEVRNDSPLPVELTSFASSVVGTTVQLNWATATEVDNYGFEVERSVDNVNFSKIGFVAGAGNSNAQKQYSYSDADLATGTYYYRLKQVDTDGSFEYSQVVKSEVVGTPTEFSLTQNYPNPFNPSTSIAFALPKESNVKLSVYNMLGEEVAVLVNGVMSAGNHSVDFAASNLNSGMYVYRLEASEFSSVRKMTLLK